VSGAGVQTHGEMGMCSLFITSTRKKVIAGGITCERYASGVTFELSREYGDWKQARGSSGNGYGFEDSVLDCGCGALAGVCVYLVFGLGPGGCSFLGAVLVFIFTRTTKGVRE